MVTKHLVLPRIQNFQAAIDISDFLLGLAGGISLEYLA